VALLAALAFTATAQETEKTLISSRHTNGLKAPKVLAPGPDDARIARIAAAILERNHYNQQPIDVSISTNFFAKYLDALDPAHMLLLQSDVKEFEGRKTMLAEDALKKGETAIAEKIFMRFMERLVQQVDYATNLIQTEKFDFNTRDRVLVNRKDQPRPATLDEAKKLWRDRVRFEYLQEKLNKQKPDEIKKTVAGRYTRQLKMLQEFDSDEVFQIYLSSLTHVYDPHSDYMGKPAADNFNISMRLSLFGIGALLRSEDGYCKIQELMEGPAKKSGQIKPNDKIIAVAQGTNPPVDVVDMKLNKVVELIRGPKGTEVRLTVVPVDAPDSSFRKIVSLIRDKIALEDSEAKARVIEDSNGNGDAVRYGYIDLPSFYADLRDRSPNRKSTTTDVAKLLKKLKTENIAGLIIDLRRNGGGSLEEAINLTGLFIKEGPVVQVRDPDGRVTVDKDTDPTLHYDGPLVVLTSRFSASASEIMAGALQDYGRAVVVGDTSTHGKGTVQTLLELKDILRTTNELGSMKITIRKFYRASGSSTQLKGVTPDIILPSVNNHADVGEAAMPGALPWDTIPSARYEPVNTVPPVLADLKKRSDERTARDKDFAFIREEMVRFKKTKEDKTISLNWQERLKEKRDNEARSEARKKELRARPEPKEKFYEITLKNAVLPGLPEPTNYWAAAMSKTNEPAKETIVTLTNDVGRVVTITNSPAKNVATTSDDDENEFGDVAKDDAPVPPVDPTLEEARRILKDLIALTTKDGAMVGKAK
jgi:carboxyl-terminal processing protease